jgi:hypothetical protein
MKIISCPIAGRSLIVQFEPEAADRLERHATRQPHAPSHGLLLGSAGGNDPKWLHVYYIEPVFGIGDIPEPSPPADPALPLITLGYYSIRDNGENLNAAELEFLAESLPASARLAVVITGKPDRRMLAQFYLRNETGVFGATPDHRQVLTALEGVPPDAPPVAAAPARSPWWWRIGVTAALAVSLLIMGKAWNSRPKPEPVKVSAIVVHDTGTPASKPAPAPVERPVRLLPKPDFTLPVQSVRQIKEPPEVAIWYPEPPTAAAPATVAEARRAVLIHPIVNQEDPR